MKHLFLKAVLGTSVLFSSQHTLAQIPRPVATVDIGRMAKDATSSFGNPDDMNMSIWMPTAYMRVVASQMKDADPESMEMIIDILDEYAMFCVTKHKIVTIGGQVRIEGTSEYDMRKIATLEMNGKKYKPLYDADLTEDALIVKDLLEPMFKNMMGNYGESMVILMFKVQDEKGNNLIDPYAKAQFNLNLGGTRLKYNLPVAALFQDRICPEDDALFPANYVYCPFHGKELEEQPIDSLPPVIEGEDAPPPPIDRQ